MRPKRNSPTPPTPTPCARCGTIYPLYQSEIRKNPNARRFCSNDCKYRDAASPLSSPGVYAIIHQTSGRLYIGSSRDLTNRWAYHRSALRKGHHENSPMQAVYDTDGLAAFEFKLLESTLPDALLATEQRWLDHHRPSGLLFNLHPIAGSSTGYSPSEETRRKIGDAVRGRRLSEATKAKISASNMGRSGRLTFGLEHRSLTVEQAGDIKRRLAAGDYSAKVARATGASAYTVGRIARGTLYRDVAAHLNDLIALRRSDGRRAHAASAAALE